LNNSDSDDSILATMKDVVKPFTSIDSQTSRPVIESKYQPWIDMVRDLLDNGQEVRVDVPPEYARNKGVFINGIRKPIEHSGMHLSVTRRVENKTKKFFFVFSKKEES
jgi:hypothetical protein